VNLDKRLIQLLSLTRFPLILAVLSGISAGILSILQARYLSAATAEVFLRNQTLRDVIGLLSAFALATISQAILKWLSSYFGHNTAAIIQTNLREKLFDKLNLLGPAYTREEKSGELSNTITEGVEILEAYFSKYIPQLFYSAVIPLTILLMIFPRDKLTVIVMLLTAPVIPVFMILIGDLAKKRTQRQWKTLSRMSAYFLDTLQGLTTLKIFGQSRTESGKIYRISEIFRKNTMDVLKIAFLSSLVLEMAATISTAVIAVEIGLRLLHGGITFQTSLFILILAPEFYQPIRQLGARFHAGMEGITAAERIFEILETKEEKTERAKEPSISHRGKIVFSDVSFTYPGKDEPVLRDINLELPSGAVTALVGPTGAGKTTLSSLLMKFIVPQTGKIRIDGTDINKISSDYWRKQISWVPQRPYLFNRTILENLLIANPGASPEEVEKAAKQAGLHNFIKNLPLGYDTPVGEYGARLSAGQVQRLSLARAFLKNAPILILDEPTGNLDPLLESSLQETIRRLTRDRTTLMIAHRLTTVLNAEQIIVLQNGRIAEKGNHRDLLQSKGLYHRLNSQYGRIS
jgi:ATP-binding cassette subfamily C protein CydD